MSFPRLAPGRRRASRSPAKIARSRGTRSRCRARWRCPKDRRTGRWKAASGPHRRSNSGRREEWVASHRAVMGPKTLQARVLTWSSSGPTFALSVFGRFAFRRSAGIRCRFPVRLNVKGRRPNGKALTPPHAASRRIARKRLSRPYEMRHAQACFSPATRSIFWLS